MGFRLMGMFKKPAEDGTCPYQAYVQQNVILPRPVGPLSMSVRFANVQPPLHKVQPAPDYEITPREQKISATGRVSLTVGAVASLGVFPK